MDSARKSPATRGKVDRAEYLSSSTIIEAFRRAMLSAGIETDDAIEPDGILHRVHIKGHRKGTKNGSYILHADRFPAGWFHHHVTKVTGTWTASGGNWRMDEATRRQIEAAKEQRRIEREQRHIQKQGDAVRLWQSAQPCESHPYLNRKHVDAHGLRIATWRKWIPDGSGWRQLEIPNTLLIPLIGADNRLWNLQGIFPESHAELGRDKDFLPGRKAGLFYVIGEPTTTIMIAEGYATGATIYAMTGKQTVIAFDCGNLKAVAQIVRQAHPNATIILCADNDRHTPGNPGVTKAREAALAVGGKLSIPTFPDGTEGTDWNDFHALQRFAGSPEKSDFGISPLGLFQSDGGSHV